jgi:hypothetical protein
MPDRERMNYVGVNESPLVELLAVPTLLVDILREVLATYGIQVVDLSVDEPIDRSMGSGRPGAVVTTASVVELDRRVLRGAKATCRPRIIVLAAHLEGVDVLELLLLRRDATPAQVARIIADSMG